MKKIVKCISFLFIIGFLFVITGACSKTSAPTEGEDQENVTIRWAHQWDEEHFEENYGELLREKFPNVTIEVQQAGTDHPETLENIIAADKTPDVVTMGLLTHTNFLDDLGLAYNMDELIDKEGFDLSRLEPSVVEYARKNDPNNEKGLYIIPNSRPTWSLHYNKDVFDVFGVDYPEDGMTWEEVVELAKKVTGERNGTEYRGLDLDVPYDAFTQFSQQSVDPETEEVIITESEAFKRYVGMIDDAISIPGNYPTEPKGDLFMNWGALFSEGNIAMAPAATNWGWVENDYVDIATYPVWKGYEGLNPQPNAGGFAITEPSEHKEIVLEMIDYLLSDEVQMERSKQGGASVLVNPDIHKAFAEEKEELVGKNLESLFKNEYATGPEKSAKLGGGVLWTLPVEFANSNKDINEFLRIIQEEEEELVRQQKERE
ncbi:ABC transporter substrate-binding protein [Lederbergia galactosidilytica]|uniref:Uncharacterized protein n=1 Tax=Lederbergia galactosidilytica TaxID=217031 RepID=A0A177ZQZ1_9BACI|nr:ABC transporter substrate-binding protein [Lederbergia galactosidilytica]KRG12942.1 hypothetical protein ACA30_17215 [Virgibacillus soli]OAK70194.1 hypothetical protein ABB05_12630 [Lederbergia galactosidilytica]